tara:strand:- start:314 stop:613 length:300 start_codon:yes stop_codon:yes gene_type:complete
MNLYWTSATPVKGLRHFVCVNEIQDGIELNAVLVSVIDIEVNLIVPKKELENPDLWKIGWMKLKKSESITKDYIAFKNRENFSNSTILLLNESSPFYLS